MARKRRKRAQRGQQKDFAPATQNIAVLAASFAARRILTETRTAGNAPPRLPRVNAPPRGPVGTKRGQAARDLVIGTVVDQPAKREGHQMKTQCLLKRNQYHTTAWIDSEVTKLGLLVEITELGGLWEIVEIYPHRSTPRQQLAANNSFSRTYRSR